MKNIDTLIISGASMTASPWFTWADIVDEILKPKQVINLSARGTGNYYISLSCINTILKSNFKNAVCMPMFTCVDKFDMYLSQQQTGEYFKEKHKPLNLQGQPATIDSFSFWSTGSHWPLVKQNYFDNFFDTDIACTNNIIMFHTLEKICQDRSIELLPVFDMNIWGYLEQDMNNYVTQGTTINYKQFVNQPLTKNVVPMLDKKWLEFVSLIDYALDNKLPVYNNINKLHPPSDVHWQWTNEHILPKLEEKFYCNKLSSRFIDQLNTFSNEWQINY